MDAATSIVTVLAALATAAVGGVYLGFGAMVMPALGDSPRADAADVMNRINVRAPRSSFVLAFLASPVLAIVAVVLSLGRLPGADALLILIGAVLAVAGFLITGAVNVPLNNRLARDGDYAAFERRWRRSNGLRGAVSLLGGALLIGALAV
ncbi:anthrone oxygenase family protein [Leifsonia sp. NPDC058194]|uniref:anthrone oxygenase family protein n=1 Tax=Leifsonia sp. NPDC058194 TaxID=3346374 RepID=UPI0036D9D245